MRIGTLRRARRAPEPPGVSGAVRVDADTRDVLKRLRPGDLAVIDHLDLDRVSAEFLVACQVGAVVNASPSISGRYPNLGPEVLVRAGVPLLDDVGSDVLKSVDDGEALRVDGHFLYRGDQVIATGERLTVDDVEAAMERARAGLAVQLEAFVGDTIEHLRQERGLLLDAAGVPRTRTAIDGRPVVVVVRGYGYEQDLALLRHYLRDVRPVLVGVDAGADALLDRGLTPDLVVGDLGRMSEAALTCGAEVVRHIRREATDDGGDWRDGLGADSPAFPTDGTAEDAAMLLADIRGASLVVAVGTHTTLAEFLDRGRAGMPSAFLTRLRVGGKLVDAKAAGELHRRRVSPWPLTGLVLVLGCLLAAVLAAGAGPSADDLGAWWDRAVAGLQGLL
ncbi:MAG: putative cytokinetic ring protein SteA [Actinomycetes bacterium]